MDRNVLCRRAALCAPFAALIIGACTPYVQSNPDVNVARNLASEGDYLTFGVSTGNKSQNSITKNPDGSVTLKAMNDTFNAGKIAGSEDGITYYYREVDATRNFKLSATVKVEYFGGRDTDGVTVTSNGQEGFGLMARDYIPQYPGLTRTDIAASVAAGGEYQARPIDPATGVSYSSVPGGSSNMVMVGAVKRGMRAAIRYGVTGAASEVVIDPNKIANAGKSIFEYWPKELADYSKYPTLPERPEFPADGSIYQLSLVKTNSAFIATITPPAGRGVPQEYTFSRPNILKQIVPDKYYVGLFAARSAKVTFSNVSYFESDSSMDAPYVEPLPDIITPRFTIVSAATDSDADYRLRCTSNVKGLISVAQDGIIVPGVEMLEGIWYSTKNVDPVSKAEAAIMQDLCVFDVPVLDLKPGENSFQVIFIPAESSEISSNAPVKKIFCVERKAYFDVSTPIYVSPTGRKVNAGTSASPLDLDTAIAFVQAGQKIIMLNGTYTMAGVRIPRYNDGKRGIYKQLTAEQRDKVFIDFNKNPDATGFNLWGDFWRLDGFHVLNTPDKVKGLTILGNNNIVEYVKTYNNGDTGMQISGVSSESRTWWPASNTIRYCESYNNKDAALNDADGFAAKLTVGKENLFQWCVAHHNCDDGWDLFTKKESGLIPPVTLENCVTYRNGTLMDGTKTASGCNGFKAGGEGLGVMHVLKNCLAFQNGAHGFTSNSNPDIQLEACTSFDNGIPEWKGNPTADARNFTIYNGSGRIDVIAMKRKVTSILSLYTDGTGRSEDKLVLASSADGYAWLGSGSGTDTGVATRNRAGTVLVDATHPLSALVESLVPPLDAQGFMSRDAQGRFVMNGFMKLKSGMTSDVIPPGANFVY